MEKIISFFKKFFSILISLIYGTFKKEEQKEHIEEGKTEYIEQEPEKYDKASRIIESEDDREEKSRKANQVVEIDEKKVYYAKRDIQRLLFIKKKLIKLENDIKDCDNLDEIYELETEYREAKIHFDKIASIYENEKIDIPIIRNIKNTIYDTNGLLKKNKIVLDNKKYELKKNQKEKEEAKENNKQDNQIIKPKAIYEKEEQKEIIKNIEQKEEVVEDKKEENNQIKTTLTPEEIEIIKERIINHKKQEELNNIKEEKQDQEEIKTTDIEIEPEKKEINIEKVITGKIIEDTKNSNQEKKEDKKSEKLKLISGIIERAQSLAASSNISILLQMNPVVAVSSTLFINNEIKRARTIIDKKQRKLTLDKVIEAVGTNSTLQVKFIMTNSLNEIRKLKNQLKEYGNSEEVIDALNKLDELEMEIIMQQRELENQNNYTEERHR